MSELFTVSVTGIYVIVTRFIFVRGREGKGTSSTSQLTLLDPSTPIMSQPSLANYIVKKPWLAKWMAPLANWYCNAAGYRKLGLRYDLYRLPSRHRSEIAAFLYNHADGKGPSTNPS
jgi:hypothetical protein